MPITTIGSYLTTAQAFADHWTQVNTAIAPDVLTLKGGYTLANFNADRAALQTAIDAVISADNARQMAAEDRDLKKAALLTRFSQFRHVVRGLFPGTQYFASVPRAPKFNAVQSRFLQPLKDMADHWSRINAATIPGFTPPLTLSGGYALATFNTELAALQTAFDTVGTTSSAARSARESRNVLLRPLRERFQQYRGMAAGKLPPGHPLLASIPVPSPPAGSTPDPVAASGMWDADLVKGVITWEPSANPDLAQYEIRHSPGSSYNSNDETVIGNIAPAAPRRFETLTGLVAPGAEAVFKVYVVLTTGNERGSATVKITRPAS